MKPRTEPKTIAELNACPDDTLIPMSVVTILFTDASDDAIDLIARYSELVRAHFKRFRRSALATICIGAIGFLVAYIYLLLGIPNEPAAAAFCVVAAAFTFWQYRSLGEAEAAHNRSLQMFSDDHAMTAKQVRDMLAESGVEGVKASPWIRPRRS